MTQHRTLIPYDSAEQVLCDMEKHGPMVKNEFGYYAIVRINSKSVNIAGHHPENFSMEDVLERFIWADGTPFGQTGKEQEL